MWDVCGFLCGAYMCVLGACVCVSTQVQKASCQENGGGGRKTQVTPTTGLNAAALAFRAGGSGELSREGES